MSKKKKNTETALIVVPQPEPEPEVKIKPPPTYPEIKTNDFVVLKRKGFENAPQTDKLFHLIANDGIFMNRDTSIGQAWIRLKSFPRWIPELGGQRFTWKGERIPAEICAMTHSFFKRIYEKYQTEAEVIYLMNYETKEWEIIVPLQKVSSSHVTSALVPERIPTTHQVVGSAHSHAAMSAFHSGTDMGDASDMDGVHFTLGKFDEERQQVVSMVMINGVDFEFKPEEISDWSDVNAAAAPEEWDELVYPHSRLNELTDEQKKIFVEYGKERVEPKRPTTVTTQPYKSQYQSPYYSGGHYGNWEEWENSRESWKNWQKPESKKVEPIKNTKTTWKSWEDALSDDVIDYILQSAIFTDDDWDQALEHKDSGEIEFWQTMFLTKLSESVTILGKLGIAVDYHAYNKNGPKPKLKKRYNRVMSEDLLPLDGDKTLEGDYKVLSGDEVITEVEGEIESDLARSLREQGFELLKVEKDEDGTERVHIDVGKFKLTDD